MQTNENELPLSSERINDPQQSDELLTLPDPTPEIEEIRLGSGQSGPNPVEPSMEETLPSGQLQETDVSAAISTVGDGEFTIKRGVWGDPIL